MIDFRGVIWGMCDRLGSSICDPVVIVRTLGLGHIDYKNNYGSFVRSVNKDYVFTKGQIYEIKNENGQRITRVVGKKYFRDFPRMSDNEVLMFQLQTGINVKEAFKHIDESYKRVEIAYNLVYDNNITDLKTFRDAIKNHKYFKENK